jgi:hypothetical protein
MPLKKAQRSLWHQQIENTSTLSYGWVVPPYLVHHWERTSCITRVENSFYCYCRKSTSGRTAEHTNDRIPSHSIFVQVGILYPASLKLVTGNHYFLEWECRKRTNRFILSAELCDQVSHSHFPTTTSNYTAKNNSSTFLRGH